MAVFGGLMSGTSLDGVDGVLAEFDEATLRPGPVLAHVHEPFGTELYDGLLSLQSPGPDELHRSALAGNALMASYAAVVERLLVAANCSRSQVRALGAHGQTVRHQPQAHGGPGYSVQLANGALLAEWTGIAVVCDFRSADVAAGGQGAPLVPAFHSAAWAIPGHELAVLNVGGVSNLSLIHADGGVRGFDTGPGNLLMDLWCRRAFGSVFDDGGGRASSGKVVPGLLEQMLADPYFALAPPKSTGRDRFDGPWLDRHLEAWRDLAAADVLATLCELTAGTVAKDLKRHAPRVEHLRVCGGGARNRHLLSRLQALLPNTTVEPTDTYGVPCDQVEALAFAWLAARRWHGLPGNLPQVTGARGPRVLGALYLAP